MTTPAPFSPQDLRERLIYALAEARYHKDEVGIYTCNLPPVLADACLAVIQPVMDDLKAQIAEEQEHRIISRQAYIELEAALRRIGEYAMISSHPHCRDITAMVEKALSDQRGAG